MREWHLLSLRVGEILFTLEINQDQKYSSSFPEYEVAVKRLPWRWDLNKSHSHLKSMVKIVPHDFTTCVDAYLTLCVKEYMFDGNRAILSGPAGGVVGYAMTSFEDKPIIGYNMEVEHFHHSLASTQ
ncbi:uncharacterized protein LOC143453443 isoform X2 [Clavelina lepadiformis]|uniref:uncharacterized protein LOC143453443 isoform X2 n=1 Tax=Clavelina lepadiformis TaxID=159417 RepID=UPI0040423D6C